MSYHNITHLFKRKFKHKVINTSTKHRELTIVLPGLENNPGSSICTEFVKTFAYRVNSLTIDHNLIQPGQNDCEFLLRTVFTRCIRLDTLTLCSGIYNYSWPLGYNTTVHTLDLRRCYLSLEFLKVLSATSVGLRQLILSDFQFAAKVCVDLPKTELQQLDLDLKQFGKGVLQQESINIVDGKHQQAFYIDFEKKQSMIPVETQMPN